MKILLALFILSLSITGYSQDEKIVCGQLPMAKVDQLAKVVGDLNDLVKSSMHKSLNQKGAHTGIFKLYVDCNGDILKLKFERGDMSDDQQKSLYDVLEKTEWKGAILDGKPVTTIVFVTIDVNNGAVETTIQ